MVAAVDEIKERHVAATATSLDVQQVLLAVVCTSIYFVLNLF
jgi:hypothetical protein